MRNTSQTYQTLLAHGADFLVRALISEKDGSNQVAYEHPALVSASVSASMFGDTPATVGNCYVKELKLVLWTENVIPRMAKIVMQYCLSDGTTTSAWYPKGTYYVDTRKNDKYGRLVITAYDSMLMLETPFCTEGEQGEWPIQDWDVVREIRDRAGITLDSSAGRTIINHYDVQYPGFGEGAMTMRDVLGYIGSMYGGNWVITDDNKLRIIVLGDIPNIDTSYLINSYGSYITFGGYRINVG